MVSIILAVTTDVRNVKITLKQKKNLRLTDHALWLFVSNVFRVSKIKIKRNKVCTLYHSAELIHRKIEKRKDLRSELSKNLETEN